MDMHKKTGLSNEAITMLEQMHKTSKNGDLTDITALVDSLLSDRDFYVFMEESQQQIDHINELGKWTGRKEMRSTPELICSDIQNGSLYRKSMILFSGRWRSMG